MFSKRTAWNLAPNAFSRALEAHRRGGRELLDLTASNPTLVGLRYDEPAILAPLAHSDALTYCPEPKGLLSARQAVADYYGEVRDRVVGRSGDRAIGRDQQIAPITQSDNHAIARSSVHPFAGSTVDPASITLTVSTSEAYSFLFRLLCDSGDEILVPTPSYPLFEFLATLDDVRLVPHSLFYDHEWQIDFHSLESALTPRSRAIILVNPNNPTGSYVKLHEREMLRALCRERELALIVDEVFLDYVIGEGPAFSIFNGAFEDYALGAQRNRSFAFEQDALIFTLSGISKICGLPQMKLAWIVATGPEELVRNALARLEVIADTYLSVNTPIQLAAPALLAQRHTICEQLLARIRANLAELDRQLAAPSASPAPQSPCSRLDVEGGWYVILRVPATRTDEQLAIALLEKGNVLVQPGYFYDFHQDGYLVLSLITPEGEFREGVQRLLKFVAGDLR